MKNVGELRVAITEHFVEIATLRKWWSDNRPTNPTEWEKKKLVELDDVLQQAQNSMADLIERSLARASYLITALEDSKPEGGVRRPWQNGKPN